MKSGRLKWLVRTKHYLCPNNLTPLLVKSRTNLISISKLTSSGIWNYKEDFVKVLALGIKEFSRS